MAGDLINKINRGPLAGTRTGGRHEGAYWHRVIGGEGSPDSGLPSGQMAGALGP